MVYNALGNMKNYIKLIDVKFRDGSTALDKRFALSGKQSRLLCRMRRNHEDGRDGNLFRQAAVSFADQFAKESGIVSFSAVGCTLDEANG